MKRLIILAAMACSALPTVAQESHTTVATSHRLGDITRIYVGSLGEADGSELIRQKVINRLLKSGVLMVTEDPATADAMLTGASGISKRHYLDASFGSGGGFASGGTRFSADCAVHLIDKNKTILWVDESTSRRILYGSRSVRSVSSNVADKMVKHLTEAISADRNVMTVGTVTQAQ